MCGGRAESAERDRYLGGAFLRDGQASGIVNRDFSFPEKQFQSPCRPEKRRGGVFRSLLSIGNSLWLLWKMRRNILESSSDGLGKENPTTSKSYCFPSRVR